MTGVVEAAHDLSWPGAIAVAACAAAGAWIVVTLIREIFRS